MLLDARPRPTLLTGRWSAWWGQLTALVPAGAVLGGLRGVEPPAPGGVRLRHVGVRRRRGAAHPLPRAWRAAGPPRRGPGRGAGRDSHLATLGALAADLTALTAHETPPPMPAGNGLAAMVAVPITVGSDSSEAAETIATLRVDSRTGAIT